MKFKRSVVERQIETLLKECEDQDWGYDSGTGDEFCEVTFNHARAKDNLIKFIEGLGVEFCYKKS